MNRLMKAGLIALSVFFLALPMAQAGHGMGEDKASYGHCGSMGMGMKDDFESKFFYKAHLILSMADELGLSDAQKETIQNLAYDVKKTVIKQDADIEILKQDVMREMHKSTFDVEAVNKLVDQKYEMKKQKAKTLVQGISDLKKTLSEDQLAKLKDLYKGKSPKQEAHS